MLVEELQRQELTASRAQRENQSVLHIAYPRGRCSLAGHHHDQLQSAIGFWVEGGGHNNGLTRRQFEVRLAEPGRARLLSEVVVTLAQPDRVADHFQLSNNFGGSAWRAGVHQRHGVCHAVSQIGRTSAPRIQAAELDGATQKTMTLWHKSH